MLLIVRGFHYSTFTLLNSAAPLSSSPRALGELLSATTASIFDLFRALTPVVQAEMMELSPSLRMRFSNDCYHLSSEVARISTLLSPAASELHSKLEEAGDKLAVVAEQRFDAELVSGSGPSILTHLLMDTRL